MPRTLRVMLVGMVGLLAWIGVSVLPTEGTVLCCTSSRGGATEGQVSLGVPSPHLAAAYAWYASVDDASALSQDDPKPRKHYGRAALEVLILLAAGTALYWADAETNSEDWDLGWDLESWRQKLVTGEGIAFDTNRFFTNAVTHAAAGALYYQAARTNNLTILESFLYALAGSTIWEFVGEFSEKVSINDMILTPFAGMATGEVFAQLGAFFDQGANTMTNRALATFLAPFRQLHNWLDHTTPRRAGNVDRFGFRRDRWHRFRLWAAGGLATAHDTSGAERGSEATGVVELGLETRLVNIPAYQQPGQVSRWLTDGNFSTLRLTATLGQDGLRGFFFFTKVALAGYYTQHIEPDGDGHRRGSSLFIGVATAFDYGIERRLGREDDRVAVVNILGPTLVGSWFHHGMVVEASVDVFGNFALVRSYAVDTYLANGGSLEGAKSVLAENRYYYAWGVTVAPRLRVTYRGFELGGTVTYEYFDSIEGADRFPEQVTNDFNLTDQRLTSNVWVTYAFPNDLWRFGFRFEHRYRHGELREVSDASMERRYMLSLMLLF